MIKYFCDKCEKEVTDRFEKQEMVCINFTGGYGSVFGDGLRFKLQLCQDCALIMFKTAGVLEVGLGNG